MKNTIVYLLVFLGCLSISQAQNGGIANNWYFGNGAGINFNTGVPTSITSLGPIYTTEGVATISDINGNLLFSTDGMFVYNQNNVQMPNGFGLLGDPSSTQSGVIVPDPANANLYYIFTSPAMGGNGIAYSVVDMTLAAGLGDVTIKNVPLVSPADEKITAVRNCNANSYWVICHHQGNNAYYAYPVTTSGVGTPVISNVGSVTGSAIGYLKASPNGQRLAAAIDLVLNNNIEVFDFDNLTGVISNPVYISNPGYGYGVAFSPDNTKLYVGMEIPGPGSLYQYDLTAANISASAYQMSSVSEFGALQLAPDGKIYGSIYTNNYLSVINNPNVAGPGCNYVQNAIPLTVGTCQLGLPNFPDNIVFSNFDLQDVYLCAASVTMNAGAGWNSYSWSTGDTTQSIILTQPGMYWGQVATPCGVVLQDTFNVLTNISPFTLGNDTTICIGASITLDALGGGTSYSWSTGAMGQTITVNTPGSYWVHKVTPCGTLADTIQISNSPPPPPFSLGNDTTVCPGVTINLDAQAGGSSYLWSNGDITQTTTATTAGTYWVQKQTFCGMTTDTINIYNFPPVVPFNLGNDTTLCIGDVITLDALGGAVSYLWSTGATTQTITVGTPGTYTVEKVMICATLTDTITIDNLPLSNALDLGNDTTVCIGASITIDALSGGLSYLWSNGATTQTINVSTPNTYWVQKTMPCQVLIDTLKLFNYPALIGSISYNIALCKITLTATASGGTGSYQYSLNGGAYQNSPIFNIPAGTYTVTIKDSSNCTTTTNTLNIILPPALDATATAPPILCHDGTTSLTVNLTGGLAPYQYALNSDPYQGSNNYTVNFGSYFVTVQDANGCKHRTPTIYIGNPNPLSITATVGILCYHGTTTLNAVGAGGTGIKQYSLDGSSYQTSRNFTVSTGGTYMVTVQDANNCTANTTINLFESLPIEIQILQIDSAYCNLANGKASVFAIGGNGGFTYTWLTNPIQYNDTLELMSEGTYHIHVTDAEGCKKDSFLFIPNVPPPYANYISRPDNNYSYIYENDTIQFFPNTTGVYSYSWDFSDGSFSTEQNPIHTFPNIGEYPITLTVYDEHKECPDTYTLRYKIMSHCSQLYIPDAFSPNGDGYNDVFSFLGTASEFQATIFDRWGKEIIRFTSINDRWDGKNMPEGVYTYVLNTICEDGKTLKRAGTITLTR